MRKLILFLLTLFISMPAIESAEWSVTDSTLLELAGHETVGFTDGKIMTIGGQLDPYHYNIYDPATGTWTRGDLPVSGIHELGILLPNAEVLYNSGTSVYIYHPDGDTWSNTGLSSSFDSWNCYTLLKDGKVLIMYDGQQCKLYDYFSKTMSATGSMSTVHRSGVEVLLPSGEVLVSGGGATAAQTNVCELYNPIAGTWSVTGTMSIARKQHVGVLLPLPWNQVLVTGPGITSELYDPNLGTWTTTGSRTYTNQSIAELALLPSGKVLMIGGANDGDKCELYDPATGTWSITDTMKYVRSHLSASILVTGKIMAMGSFTDHAGGVIPEIYDYSVGVWQAKAPMNTGRRAATITSLPIIHTPNCSTNILIAGGENAGGTLNSCELYNYKKDSISVTGNLNTPRCYHTATLLPSSTGEVLVAGGQNAGTALSSSEVFDLSSGVWNNTAGPMSDARFDHSATLLKNGTVLVTGGENSGGYLNSCEIYNSGTWTATGAMTTPRARHSAILLLNGNIMVIGGETTGGTPTNSCEIWDGANWAPATSLANARSLHTATLLQSGKVLVTGGRGTGGTALNSSEIYDPGTNTWSAEANLNTARYAHNTTLLYSGLMLVSGGTDGTNYFSSCEIWDPASDFDFVTRTHKWKTTTPMSAGKAYQMSVLIPYLHPYVYTIGGYDGSTYFNTIEQYDVGLGYQDIWQSTITNFPAVTHISSTMNVGGTLLRGVSEADGGNYCHVSANDRPVISLVRVGGGNWQGNGGGEILHMPLSSSWNEAHTLVAPEIYDFQGYYKLWSIVNGIPCKWYADCGGNAIEENSNLKTQNSKLTIAGNKIYLSIPDAVRADLKLYDICGRLKEVIYSGNLSAGSHTFTPEVKTTGVYFVKLDTGEHNLTKKLVLIK